MNQPVRRLEDLARLAATSIATVSRALRDDPSVKAETKQRIVALAIEHQFPFQRYAPPRPTETALAVVIPPPLARQPRLADPFLMELLASLAEAARERGCDLVVSHATPSSEAELRDLLRRPGVDGTIFLGQSSLHDAFNVLADEGHRFAVWGAALPGQRYCSIGSDNPGGAARATRHLLRLGRRRIVFLGAPLNPEIRQRRDGYLRALAEAGQEPDPALLVDCHFDLESAESAVADLIAAKVAFDGIVAASDILAFGAIRCLTRLGLDVPRDISVVGYDNVAFGAYLRPALTTIAQDAPKAGRVLVARLLGGKGELAPLSERLPTDLIVRESCGG